MKAGQILKIAEQFLILAKKRTIRTCMHKGCKQKDDLTQVLWADGRALAVLCDKHLDPWIDEDPDKRDIIWKKPYDADNPKKNLSKETT